MRRASSEAALPCDFRKTDPADQVRPQFVNADQNPQTDLRKSFAFQKPREDATDRGEKVPVRRQ